MKKIYLFLRIISKTILVLTFIPCIIFPIVIVFTAFNGMDKNTLITGYYITTKYGWESVISLGTILLLIIIIPCIIYQLIYVVIKRFTGDKKILKKAAISILITFKFLIYIIILISIAEIKSENKKQELISAGTEAVNSYLIEKYKNDDYNKIQITNSEIGNGDIFDINNLPPIYYTVTYYVVTEKNNNIFYSHNSFKLTLAPDGTIR